MSRVSSRFQTSTLTVWPVTAESDGYSEATYGTPFTVGCEYDQKPKVMKDDSGNEFVPEFTYYVTATLGQIERDWFNAYCQCQANSSCSRSTKHWSPRW